MPRTAGAKAASFEEKLTAVRLLESGVPLTKVAKALGRSRIVLWKWKVAYAKEGEEGLRRKPVPGRPRKLSDKELRKLVFCLARGPGYYGFPNEVWTLRRIADVIKKEFGVKYHPGHVWKLLVRLGFSHQRPRKVAVERNDKEVERWKRRVWPQYRRMTNGGKATIAFLDESGRSETPTVVATWAPKGKSPVLKHVFSWEKCSIISAITPGGRLHYKLYSGSIRSDRVVKFLKHLLRWTPGKLVLFWDGSPTHRSRHVADFLREYGRRLSVRLLPPYAPDVNPGELVYRRLKCVEVANSCPKNLYELLTETRCAMERIRRKPDIIRSFFHTTGLLSSFR